MRILFCAWHMHANQNGWVSCLIENGHSVRYLVQHVSLSDSPGDFQTDLVPPLASVPSSQDASASRLHYYWRRRRRLFPNIRKIVRLVLYFRPEVIVIRELSAAAIVAYFAGRLVTNRFVRYIQHPAFCDEPRLRLNRSILQRAIGRLFRSTITPIMGSGSIRRIPGIRHIPFLVPGPTVPPRSNYLDGGRVNFFSIGKFSDERKCHAVLIRALDRLSGEFDFNLTLFGAVRTAEDRNYNKILALIESSRIRSRTVVRTNVPIDECRLEYLRQDVFVLPSANEPAAYSPFEALKSGLAVVCTTENGTRFIVEEGRNGFIVPPRDVEALVAVLRRFLLDTSVVERMGHQSALIYSAKYNARVVYDALMEAFTA